MSVTQLRSECEVPIEVGQIVHVASWNLGWIVLGAAWLGPLPMWAVTSFAAHMTLHMAVVAVAAPLLAIGISGRRYDPVRKWPVLFAPVIASLGELVIVWAWHTPRLHHWARFETTGFVCEQLMFVAAGLWVWMSAFGGSMPRSAERSGAGVIALLLTSMHMTLLGALLALSQRLLFAHHQSVSGLDPVLDQNLGGAIMLVVGGIVFLSGGLWLVRDVMRYRVSTTPHPVHCAAILDPIPVARLQFQRTLKSFCRECTSHLETTLHRARDSCRRASCCCFSCGCVGSISRSSERWSLGDNGSVFAVRKQAIDSNE